MQLQHLAARVLAGVLVSGLFSGACLAQNYPTRAIRLIVPFAPGGIYDYIGRLVSPKLSESLGQTVVVDNRSGGGGVIAMQIASKSTPDGYTVLLANPSLVTNVHLHRIPPYDLKELAPVTILATAGLILAVNPKVPARSVKELIELAKASKVTYGSAGVGSTPHMAGELFKASTGADLTHVPYKGVGPAVAALVGGEVQMLFGSVAGTADFIRAGRLRGLATTGQKRARALPDIPTLAEAGYHGAEVELWAGILVPANTPKTIIARLNADFRKILTEPDVKNGMDKVVIEPAGTSPEEAAAFLSREYGRWGKVIKTAGITID